MKEVERSLDYGRTFQELPQLPNKISSLCLVVVDKERIFIAGGFTPHPISTILNTAYMINLTESSRGWLELLPLSLKRYAHTCGKVGPELNPEKIVVVGGCNDGGCRTRLNSVEIYTIDTGSWETGRIINLIIMFLFCKKKNIPKTITTARDFPHPIIAHGQVKYEQSFLIIGGQTYYPNPNLNLLDTIYLYNNINGTWSVMQTRLDEKQMAVSATWVDAAKFPSRSATANSNKDADLNAK